MDECLIQQKTGYMLHPLGLACDFGDEKSYYIIKSLYSNERNHSYIFRYDKHYIKSIDGFKITSHLDIFNSNSFIIEIIGPSFNDERFKVNSVWENFETFKWPS